MLIIYLTRIIFGKQLPADYLLQNLKPTLY